MAIIPLLTHAFRRVYFWRISASLFSPPRAFDDQIANSTRQFYSLFHQEMQQKSSLVRLDSETQLRNLFERFHTRKFRMKGDLKSGGNLSILFFGLPRFKCYKAGVTPVLNSWHR